MAEIRRGFGGGDTFGERLPWLEPVDEEPEPDEGGFGGLILAGLAVVAAIAIIVGGVVWLRHAKAREADLGTIIRAPIGPYKIKPSDPGGMEIASAGAVAERTGVGADINGQLDPSAVPEQPIAGPGSPEGARPAAVTPAPVPVVPAPMTPVASKPIPAAPVALIPAKPAVVPTVVPTPHVAEAKPASSGAAGSIQLGAFSTEAKAHSAWKTLAKRFDYLAALTEIVAPVASGDTTLYRLRASGAGAAKVCGQLKLAGESCAIL